MLDFGTSAASEHLMIARNLPLTTMDRRSDVRDANVDRWVHLIGHLLGGTESLLNSASAATVASVTGLSTMWPPRAPKWASPGRVKLLTPSLRTDPLSGGSRIGSDRIAR